MLQKRLLNLQFLSIILFTVEASFTRHGIFNFHNSHEWSDENSHAHVQHQFSINEWAGREFLNRQFPQRWIGRDGPLSWPPRSPDLTSLDFYLWGHAKELVYKNTIETEDQL
ncbi:hypothetical protein WN51_02031 [Melipona quadrifasciata]|uniref:Uncharacterized protein n=1 Tax=Melipona quadrifasciata TaxID=166423 RepID=A0A0M9AD02_9HYME|nr:hypothetical protein WN51_02031 [Melipona quadrifasciata]